jgi:hypothetical protein
VVSANVALNQATAKAAAAHRAAVDAGVIESAAQVQVANARATITEMATVAYEDSGLLSLNVLMNPGSPTDMMDRLTILDQLSSTRQKDLAGYRAAQMHAIDATNKAKQAQIVADAAANAAGDALVKSQGA